MASTSSSGSAQCEHTDDVAGEIFQVVAPGSPLSERIHDIPLATTTEPTSRLFAYLRSTCYVLGYLASCLPSIQVGKRDEEANLTSDAVDVGQIVHIVSSSNVADSDESLKPKHKIFLSHSGAQKDFVEQLCVDLERCDRHPSFDKRRHSLPIGEEFPN